MELYLALNLKRSARNFRRATRLSGQWRRRSERLSDPPSLPCYLNNATGRITHIRNIVRVESWRRQYLLAPVVLFETGQAKAPSIELIGIRFDDDSLVDAKPSRCDGGRLKRTIAGGQYQENNNRRNNCSGR